MDIYQNIYTLRYFTYRLGSKS